MKTSNLINYIFILLKLSSLHVIQKMKTTRAENGVRITKLHENSKQFVVKTKSSVREITSVTGQMAEMT